MKITIAVVLVGILLLSSLPGLASGYDYQHIYSGGTVEGALSVYNVTFEEQNLSQGVTWGVDVNSSSFYSQTSRISVHLANGSYNYSIMVENRSFGSPYPQGSFLVSGHPMEIPVEFVKVTYPVVFNEKGLPSNSTWIVSVGNVSRSIETGSGGTGDYVTFNLINGSYKWTANSSGVYVPLPQNGSFTVSGNFNVVNLQFEQAYSQIVFEDIGLPQNVSWYVDFNGSIKYSNASIITFIAPYGNYSYFTGSNDTDYHSFMGFRALPVSNLDIFVNVYFWSENYTVTFTESGLPSGMQWSVWIGSQHSNSTNSTISLSLPNGTYHYFLSSSSRAYAPVNSSGSFAVNGINVRLSTVFEPSMYNVVFNRSGPAGLKWLISTDGENVTSNSSIISFRVIYGEHNYTIMSFNNDYLPSPMSGIVYVWANTTITVFFSPILYKQIFTERGLPSSSTWNVTLGNNTIQSSGNSIVFNETNGTYSFHIHAIDNYTVSPSSGTIVVAGASRAYDVKFTSFVLVSFDVSGIPKGASWSITIDGKQVNSSSPILSVRIPNGTYYYVPGNGNNFTYYVSLPSGYSLVSENSFNAMSSVTVPLVGQLTGGGIGPQHYLWGVLIILIGVAIVLTIIVEMLTNKQRRDVL